MKKKQPTRNLYIDLSKRIIELKIKLLAHHHDDKDFGLKETDTVNTEFLPLIKAEKSAYIQTYCYDELNGFIAWCVNKRRQIIEKYYPEENTNE